jgi:hypothetical protein
MPFAATVEPRDTINADAHVSGRFVYLKMGLTIPENFCMNPSSIRMPVPKSPRNIIRIIGIAKSSTLKKTDNMEYCTGQEVN